MYKIVYGEKYSKYSYDFHFHSSQKKKKNDRLRETNNKTVSVMILL